MQNRGYVFSSGAIGLSVTDVSNEGLLNAAGDLSISADSLVNDSTLFAGGDMSLLLGDSLGNRRGASIFAVGNLLLAADDSGGKTGDITNQLALIQSYEGDIDIRARRFENLGFADIQYEMIYYDLGHDREVSDPLDALQIDLAYNTGYTKHRSTAPQPLGKRDFKKAEAAGAQTSQRAITGHQVETQRSLRCGRNASNRSVDDRTILARQRCQSEPLCR